MKSMTNMLPLHHPVALFVALGAASGAVSSLLTWVVWEAILPDSPFDLPDPAHLPHGYIPGLVFGLTIGIALVRIGRSSGVRAVLFALGATVSCFVAYMIYFVLPDAGPQVSRLPGYPLAGLVANTIGSMLIAVIGVTLFDFMRQVRPCILIVLIGGALGAASDIFAPVISDIGSGALWKFGAVAFYAVWQGAIAGAMATGLSDTPKEDRG